MPVGKELGKYKGQFNGVRTCSVVPGDTVVEGSYTAAVSDNLSGTAVGTMTFTGAPERGTLVDLGVGYLDSGEVIPYKAHGVYWASGKGTWETRAAAVMGDEVIVVEGQISMSGDSFSLSGVVSELT